MKRKIYDKGNLLISCVLFFLIVTTTIVYSGLSTRLALVSDVIFRVAADIRVTDIKLESSTNGAVENYSPKYNVSETTMGFTLPNVDSSITYKVTVTNFGGIDQTIYNFIEKSLNVDSNDVEITVSDFIPVCTNAECNLKNDNYTIVTNKILNNNNPVQKDFLVTIKAKKQINNPINLIEKYEFRKVYTISFDSQGGTEVPDIRKVDGVDVNIPNTIPGLYGHTFVGWTETKDETSKKYKNNDIYSENKDVLLYAQWEKIECSLNIDYLVDDVLYENGYNNKIYTGLKINNVDIGYVENYSEKLEYGTSYEIYGFKIDGIPVSYLKKGKLETNEVVKLPFYTVNFLVNDEHKDYINKSVASYIVKKGATYTTTTEKISFDDGRTAVYSINPQKGYTITFDKFIIEPENNKIESKTNITANYKKTVDTYFITYDLNGGNYDSGYSNPLTYNIESDNITLINPKKEGYVFDGWTGSNSKEPQKDVTIYKGSTGDRKYTANYERDNYLFEIEKDNGIKSFDVQIKESGKTEEILKEQTSYSDKLSYETEITISNIQLEEGYIFDDFQATDKLTELSSTGNLVKSYKLESGSAKVSLNSTENTYKVTYISSENGGSTDIQVENVKYKSLVDLSKNSEKEKYDFIGWNTDKNSRVKLDRLEMPNHDVTLYAIYKREVTANFIVQNEYSATSSSNADSCILYNNDKLCLITSPTLTAKEGYTVYGWNTDKTSISSSLGFMKETGINDNVTYYSILSKPIGSLNITLSGNMNYKGEKITPNVTIKDNDVILTKDKDYTVSYGENISKIGNVTISSKNVYNESSKIFYTSNVTKSFNIEPIDDVITVEAKTASYTGSKITANTAKTISNSKITYTYFDSTNCTGNQLGDAPINVGNYSVKIVSAGNDNYNHAETCVPHTITQGKPTVTLKNKEANYSGSQIQIDALTIKNPNGSIISIPYTEKYYNNSNCSGSAISAPINGGTYSAKVITNENNNLLSADSNCATLKVNPIKNPTVVTPVENIKYGENKEMVVTTKLQGTIYYSVGTELTKDNYTSGKTSIPTSKDLSKNDYNVYYYVKGNSNYKDAKGFVIVSVGILSNPITVKPVTGISYGENKEMVTTENAEGDVYYSVGVELTEDNYISEGKKAIPTSEGKNAGDHIVYYFTKGNTNYGKAAGKVTVNIAKINDTITLDPVETEYTGDAIFANTAKTTSNTHVTYKYYNGENCISENEITGAPISYRDGGYSVKATSDGGNNYYPASICVKHTINKATNPVKVSAKNDLVYSVKSGLLSVSNELYSTMYYSIGTPLTDDNYLTAGSTDIPKTYIENGSETIYRNAGDYKLYYYAKGDNNHLSLFNKDAINVNIDKASSVCNIVITPIFNLPSNPNSSITYSCVGDGKVNVVNKNIDTSTEDIIAVNTIDEENNMVSLTAQDIGKTNLSIFMSSGTNYKESEKTSIEVEVSSSKYVITLNDVDKWSSDEFRNENVYSLYKKGIYLDSETTEQMTTKANGINVPVIDSYVLNKHGNNGEEDEKAYVNYSFLGYYYYNSEKSDYDQLIDENGFITSTFTSTYFRQNTSIDMKLKKDSFVLTPPTSKSGYTFEGWFTSDGKEVTSDTDFYTEGIKDIYAHWIKAPKIKSSATSWTNTSVNVSVEEDGTSDSGDVSYQYFVSDTSDIPSKEDENWITLEDGDDVTIDTEDETSKAVYVFYRSVSSIKSGETSIVSDASNYALVQIDKIKPSTILRAYKISDDNPRVTVESDNWSNKYLEFRFNTPVTGPSGGIIYYCIQDTIKTNGETVEEGEGESDAGSDEEIDGDSGNLCIPYVKDDINNKIVAPNDIIPGTDTKEGEYTIRYMVVSGAGTASDIGEYNAMVDVTNPTLIVTTTLLDSDTVLSPIITNIDKSNSPETASLDLDKSKVWSVNGYSFSTSGTNDKIDQNIGDDDESNMGSGIESIVLKLNKVDMTSDYKAVSKEYDMTETNSLDIAGNGYRFGYITVTDKAGNKSVFVFDLRIDNVEPQIQINAYDQSNNEIASGALSATGLTYKITILKKGVSGAIVYSCSTDAASYDPENPCEPTTRLGAGTNDVVTSTGYSSFKSLDRYINVKATSGAKVDSDIKMHHGRIGTVDVDIDVYRQDNSKQVSSKSWTNSKLKFKLNSTKEPTATLKYCIDTENKCTPSTTTTKSKENSISNTGKFYIRYNATKDGVVSKTLSFAAYVDEGAPAISVTGNPTSWTKSNATLTIKSRESFSGLASLTINGKKVTTTQADNIYTAKYVASANGKVTIVATDKAGNSRTETVNVTKIDTTSPKVKINIYKSDANGNKGAFIKTITSDYSTGKWVNYYYYFELTASTDSQSGISKVTMGYSAGGKKTISTTIEKTRTLDVNSPVTTVRSNGARYLVFTVTDGAGNKSIIRVKIYIDTTPPTMSLKLYKTNTNNEKTGSPTQITATNTPISGWKNYKPYFDLSSSTDSLSGIASIKLQINKGGIEKTGNTAAGTTDLVSSSDITSKKYAIVGTSGNRYIRFIITDRAGNSVTKNVRIYIDLTKPKLTLYDGTVTSDGVTIPYKCTDSFSNVSSTTPSPAKITSSGNPVKITCTDKAGNSVTKYSPTWYYNSHSDCGSYEIPNCSTGPKYLGVDSEYSCEGTQRGKCYDYAGYGKCHCYSKTETETTCGSPTKGYYTCWHK